MVSGVTGIKQCMPAGNSTKALRGYYLLVTDQTINLIKMVLDILEFYTLKEFCGLQENSKSIIECSRRGSQHSIDTIIQSFQIFRSVKNHVMLQ